MRYRRCGGALVCMMMLLAGCNGPLAGKSAATSQPAASAITAASLGRIAATYADDLFTGRFQVIADFEDPRQATLFHREPDRAAGAASITTAKAQSSGVGSLKISLTDAAQRIVAADSPEGQWSLYADWAPYHLLLFSIYSPREQAGFRFSVRSGGNNPLTYEHPRIFLKAGWNRIRVDLGEVAEHVYLGDVREMRFWCDPLDSAIELYLDDIILADNTRVLMAAAADAPGELSVKSQGRRLVVTSAQHFELVFSRGQIRQWFDLAADPQRMRNLAGASPLGPVPVVLEPGKAAALTDGAGQWSRLGPLAESYQSLIETTPLRVSIQGEWRFGSPEAPPGEASPYHRWEYTICRGGEIYLLCSGSIKNAGTSEVGMVFSCDAKAGFQRFISQAAAPSAKDQPAYLLFSQPQQAGSADLLIVPAKPLTAQAPASPDPTRLAAVYRVPVESDQFTFAAMMRVWPNDIDTPAQAGPLALSYTQPLPITVAAGSLVRTDPGDLDGDGYSEGHGYYLLQPDGRVANVRLDGRDHLRFSPAFKLVNVAGSDVWIYVDGRLIRNTQRDEHDNLFFELPGVISREVLIEVNATQREPATPPSPPAKK